MHTTQFYLEEGARVPYVAEDILFLHVFPGEAEVYDLHWVGILLETGGFFTFSKFKVKFREEASYASSLREGYYISWIL